MSNQVYSNEVTKYYDFPGLNNYLMSSNLIDIIHLATVNIPFPINNIVNDPTIINNTTSTFVVLRDGMYSLMLNVAVQSSTNAAATDPQYIITILLDRPGQFVSLPLQKTRVRYIADGVTATNQSITSLSASIYLKKGDLLKFAYTNLSGFDTQILSADSSLVVNKIY